MCYNWNKKSLQLCCGPDKTDVVAWGQGELGRAQGAGECRALRVFSEPLCWEPTQHCGEGSIF